MTDVVEVVPQESKRRRRGNPVRGTKPIRRTIPGYGILKVASGVKSAGDFKRVDDAIVALGRAGRLDWLRALDPKLDGPRKPLEVVQLLREYGTADRLPDPNVKPFTLEVITEWLSRWRVSIEHHDHVRQHLQALCKLTNSVDDLPRVIREEKKRLEAAGKYHQFKTRKKAALTYLRAEIGPRHAATMGVEDVKTPTAAQLGLAARPHNHHSLAQALSLAVRLGPGYDEDWMTLWLTGARPTEYWDGRLSHDLETGHIHIAGKKNLPSNRRVPLLKVTGPDGRVWKPRLGAPAKLYQEFQDRLRHITDRTVVPRDGRRSYALWLVDAGLDYIYRQVYMGHAVDMTARYSKQGLVRAIDANATHLNHWLSGQDKQEGMSDLLYDKVIVAG